MTCQKYISTSEIDSKSGISSTAANNWLHWQQSFGGLNGNSILTRIVHSYPLKYSEGYKNLWVDLTLSKKQTEDSFWNLALLFASNRHGNSDSSTHYHYLSLDRCAVRVFLKGTNGKHFTRWVHVNCTRLVMACETPESVVLATFKDPCFISDDLLKELRSDAISLPTDEFGEIEIHGRLKIWCCHLSYNRVDYNNCKINEGFENWFGQDLSLTIRPKMFSNSFNDSVTIDSQSVDADIKFVMEYDSNKKLTAHSFVLAAQSPVLRKMLTIDMVEKRKARDILELLPLAHKYQVDYLMRISCMIIMTYENEDLDVGEIRNMYHAGCLFHLLDLEQRAFQWLKWRRGAAQGEGYKEVIDLLEELDERFAKSFCSFLLRSHSI
ncbi:unnamed protein product [Allacma fusca]|uniref:BTB domain-containing protein n=1 Tax=Allacma fusca TaxID=39272 RepID=A0A8J2PNJ2_9HEXA|nr:unnamed protein product [Allacma fusca]